MGVIGTVNCYAVCAGPIVLHIDSMCAAPCSTPYTMNNVPASDALCYQSTITSSTAASTYAEL